ncbi:MAG: ribonuclease Z [Candidatus Woesearchaeota archaeon]|nr:ribonuclease Z [Candidatus Woesearchaeota archaeon]
MALIELTFLGTSAMVPTKERNVQAVFLKYDTEGILFDCGEGTQRQMNIAGINRFSITRIFISHWHGDHIAGLVGLIQTLGKRAEQVRLQLHGPKGTKLHMEHLLKCSVFDQRIDLTIFEHTPRKATPIFESEDFCILAAPMHHTIPTLGYAFVQKDRWRVMMDAVRKLGIPEGPHLQQLQKGKSITYQGKKIEVDAVTERMQGKKIVIIPDTAPCASALELAQDADILVSESTYTSEHAEKAEEHCHMTAAQAGMLANQANAQKLILTHFSQRYKSVHAFEEEAKTYFPNVVCAYDFMHLNL